MLIRHAYLRNTTITIQSGDYKLDDNGQTEVPDEELLGHPDIIVQETVIPDTPMIEAPLSKSKKKSKP